MCNSCECKCQEKAPRVPHKHAEVIKAWAEGSPIQVRRMLTPVGGGVWVDCASDPKWLEHCEYRIKPEPKPDFVQFIKLGPIDPERQHPMHNVPIVTIDRKQESYHNLKAAFDGETGKLKSVEIVK